MRKMLFNKKLRKSFFYFLIDEVMIILLVLSLFKGFGIIDFTNTLLFIAFILYFLCNLILDSCKLYVEYNRIQFEK